MTWSKEERRKARKDHQCCACGEMITKGTVYHYAFVVDGGDRWSAGEHLGCCALWTEARIYSDVIEFWEGLEYMTQAQMESAVEGLDETESARTRALWAKVHKKPDPWDGEGPW